MFNPFKLFYRPRAVQGDALPARECTVYRADWRTGTASARVVMRPRRVHAGSEIPRATRAGWEV